ncbi:class I SAM-dependent methyltransferase [Sporichthya polymorpha]|uniref:class I SAM-dependent methyltransferase n=1 Tax=Sporichthya polymorpha TaxID=35751 RepID=UPI0003661FCD|nr:class I SAM-dependent methyltransferase [Sporichthya polymorpha]
MSACRSCGGDWLPVLSLGETPLANALLSPDDLQRPEARFPLELAFCPTCALAQITETVPPDTLFRDYPYFSSWSDTMLKHAADLTARLVRERQLTSDSLVVEAASNDGYLLRNYASAGIGVLGIEPARNIAVVARERGIPTQEEFFDHALAEALPAADVFHAHNVLAHVPDLNGFVSGIHTVLKPNGLAVIEVPYVGDLLDFCEFDTIYHEHLSYFSLSALDHCFRTHGLLIWDVERVPIHGGTLRLFAGHESTAPARSAAAQSLLRQELENGLTTAQRFQAFAARVTGIRDRLVSLLAELKDGGGRIAAYGASAKGSTLLNYCGIGAETVDFVVDRSTQKQGRYTPGTHLLIEPPERLLADQPDYTLLLTWNFAEEILAQQAEYRHRGGRFIIPVPEPVVV